MPIGGRSVPGGVRRFLFLLAASLAGALLVMPTALGAVGVLTPRGCIADEANDPDGCVSTAKGLNTVTHMVVTRDGTSVYATGWADHAIVTFARDPRTGALTPKGCIADPTNNPDGCARTAKGLLYAQMVAVSKDGASVYVASSSGTLVRFARDTKTGVLHPRGCIADKGNNPEGCAQTANGLSGADALTVSNDGRSVYVAGYNDNAVVRFDRNTTTGGLTPRGCIGERGDNLAGCKQTIVGGLNEPYVGGVVVSPDGTSVYAVGSAGTSVAVFRRLSTGALEPRGCIASPKDNPEGCARTAKGLTNPTMVTVSADGTSVYVADYGASGVVRLARDTVTGALKGRGCIADPSVNPAGCVVTTNGLSGTEWVTVSRDGRSVYAAGTNAKAVVRFSRDRSNGALTPKGCVADPSAGTTLCATTAIGLDTPQALALSADGSSLYVASPIDNAVARFRRST